MLFFCVTSEWNTSAWDVMDDTGRRYSWGGDLYGALREARRLEKLAGKMPPS